MNEILINRQTDLYKEFKIDCQSCCGLCCTALYCSKAEGFPADKEAGVPCRNLMPDFRCKVHTMLEKQKLKGCMAYDCLGAGQIVTQAIFKGSNWKTSPESAKQIFEVFLIVHELQQMKWYLTEASMITCTEGSQDEIKALISENKKITSLPPKEILAMDTGTYRTSVNKVLRKVSELVQLRVNGKVEEKHTTDFLGKNLKRANLVGKDFSMSLLIAADLESCDLFGANFIGADLRDTNLKNNDLSQSIFLTQMQINSAKGNRATKLPTSLCYPLTWTGM